MLTQRLFLTFSELQVRLDGVNATSRHRDAVDVAVRESTGLVSEPRQFRDDVRATQVSGLARERALRGGEPVFSCVQVRRRIGGEGGGLSDGGRQDMRESAYVDQ